MGFPAHAREATAWKGRATATTAWKGRATATTAWRSRGTGFTLIEVILVVVLVGGIAGVIAVGLAGRSVGAERRRAVGGLVAELATARVEAMRTGRPVEAEAWVREGRLEFESGDRRTGWPVRRLGFVDERGRILERVGVRYQASGRADVRRWGLVDPGESARAAAGRIGWIEFDAVSGAAFLRREGELPANAVQEIAR